MSIPIGRSNRFLDTRATNASGDFVNDQQNIVAVTNLSQLRLILLRRIDDPARVTGRLDHYSGDRTRILYLDHIADQACTS